MRILAVILILVTTVNANNWKNFIDSLKAGKDVSEFIQQDELALSKRLGITYKKVVNKTVISYEPVQPEWNKIEFKYTDEADGSGKLNLKDKKQELNYYFIEGKVVSPVYYFSRTWFTKESKYFVYKCEDASLLLDYNLEKMDKFVESVFEKLNFTDELKQKLEKEKIYYFLCKDTDQIEKITGYDTRGIYNLAFDYIVTTYQCHYHELVHLMVNYRLQNLNLYTNPFLLEGLAVGLGGRGGNEPELQLQLGAFLHEANFLKMDELLSSAGFSANDVSLSYPFAGFYNDCLLNIMGAEKYLDIYAKYGSKTFATLPTIQQKDLPDTSKCNEYITNKDYKTVHIDMESETSQVVKGDHYIIEENVDCYLFYLKSDMAFNEGGKSPITNSSKFEEIYPGKEFNGAKYLITVNDNEVSLYNLYSNNLVAKYAAGFTLTGKTVTKKNDMYYFAIPKKYFDENIADLVITKVE